MDEISMQIYSRQMILPEMGESGQKKIQDASVLICGVGGLGSVVALNLCALGIGRIGLMDGGRVTWSDMNRQVLYTIDDLEMPKANRAGAQMRRHSSWQQFDVIQKNLTEENAEEYISQYDIVVDCLNNFASRLILNDTCVKLNKPFVHAGAEHLYGQIMTVIPGESPCLRCLLPDGQVPKDADSAAKACIGATCAVIGGLQVMEVYKYILGLPCNTKGFFVFDGMEMAAQQLLISANPQCSCRKKE